MGQCTPNRDWRSSQQHYQQLPHMLLRHCRLLDRSCLLLPARAARIARALTTVPRATSLQQSTFMTVPALEGLEPASLWKHFGELSQIPRPSKHEEKVLDWLKAFAAERKLEWQQDGVGNIVIRRPGSGGGEEAPPVVIQGHVDMVCEKDGHVQHDFFNDPLKLVRDGDWIKADGTTLGSDNGIGVCCALALLELAPSAKLPPLEALFTVDEETGLTGATDLDGSMLKGRTMLNLDTEDWGEIFFGCAGGGDSKISVRLATEDAPQGSTAVEVVVDGLMGGHSGLSIHEDRGNALRMAAAVADSVLAAVPGVRLCLVVGGDKRNAIPRQCTATLAVPAAAVGDVQRLVSQRAAEFQAEYGAKEAGMSIRAVPASEGDAVPAVLLPESAERLLALLLTLPHGVVKFSHAVTGLVETSNNLASVAPKSSGQGWVDYGLVTSTRSSLSAPLEQVRGSIKRITTLCGGTIEQEPAYPGWAPNPSSEVVALARKAIGEVIGHDPEVKAIHAGLECGIIGERVPGGVDAVSYGPTIRNAHSPDERVQISTVQPFWEATLKILAELADRRA